MTERMRTAAFGKLASLGSEAVAFAKQAWLMPRDVGRPRRRPLEASDAVVVIHGLFATAGPFRPLRKSIEALGADTLSFTYEPGRSVEALAERVARIVEDVPPGARIHLVGHSLGGVVARHFAERARDPRVVQTISLASPFAGIRGASLVGFGDLDPESPVLRALRLSTCEIPHLSVIAGEDTLVRPPLAHALPRGEVMVMRGLGHAGLLFDARTHAVVCDRVRASLRP